MKATDTLQKKLLTVLEAIHSPDIKPRLMVYIHTVKHLKIKDDDYINVLAFIKLLLDTTPSAAEAEQPLIQLYQHCRNGLDASIPPPRSTFKK